MWSVTPQIAEEFGYAERIKQNHVQLHTERLGASTSTQGEVKL
jgi:hypothetical protein